MKKRKITSITYGALVCAMAGALLLVNRYVLLGGLDVYLYWIIPLPVIVYCVKFSTRDTIVMGVSMILLSFVLSTPTTVFYVAGAVIAGIVYGDGMNRGRSSTFLVVTLFLVSLITAIVTTFLFAAAFGYNLASEIEFYQETFAKYLAGNSPLVFSRTMIINIIVLSTILSSAMEGVLVHLFATAVLKKLKMTIPPMKPIGLMTAPMWVKVYVIAAALVYAGTRLAGLVQYDDYIFPLFAVGAFFCSVFGYIAVTTYVNIFYLRGRKSRLFPLLLGLSYFVLFYLYAIIGLFDMFSDRRIRLIEEIQRMYEEKQKENN